MKASELINELRNLVSAYGDREIEVNGNYANATPLCTNSRFEIDCVDLYDDSNNIQILVNNHEM